MKLGRTVGVSARRDNDVSRDSEQLPGELEPDSSVSTRSREVRWSKERFVLKDETMYAPGEQPGSSVQLGHGHG